jgi:hypothetical protein
MTHAPRLILSIETWVSSTDACAKSCLHANPSPHRGYAINDPISWFRQVLF